MEILEVGICGTTLGAQFIFTRDDHVVLLGNTLTMIFSGIWFNLRFVRLRLFVRVRSRHHVEHLNGVDMILYCRVHPT